MLLNIKLFARLREIAGRASCQVELPQPATVADLRRAVAEQLPSIGPHMAGVLIAINEAYQRDETAEVALDDAIALIPPVSGG